MYPFSIVPLISPGVPFTPFFIDKIFAVSSDTRDIFEKYLDKHINGAYEITNFLAYDDSGRGQYTVVVYRDQEKKKKIDTFGIDTSGNFTN